MFVETEPGKVSFEQYLQDERSRAVRHEYVAGHVYAMAGGSAHHNLITGNLYVALRLHYRDSPCRVFQENLLVRIQWLNRIASYYPDVMVCCDPADSADAYYCERPCLLAEVLSDSTARTDRHEKLRAYTHIPSLHAYLIVAQQAMHVTLHRRATEWEPEVLTRADETVTLDCGVPHAPLQMTLAQIYDSVF